MHLVNSLVLLVALTCLASSAQGGLFDFLDKNGRNKNGQQADKTIAQSNNNVLSDQEKAADDNDDVSELQKRMMERKNDRLRAPVESRTRPDPSRIQQAAREQARLAQKHGFSFRYRSGEEPASPGEQDFSEKANEEVEETLTQVVSKFNSPLPDSAGQSSIVSPLHVNFPSKEELKRLRGSKELVPSADEGDQADGEDDGEEDEEELDDSEYEVTVDSTGRTKKMHKEDIMNLKFVDTRVKNGIDKNELRPNLKRYTFDEKMMANKDGSKGRSKFLKPKFWGDKMNKAYKATKNVINDIPKYVEQASNSVSKLLQLDNKGRLLALIQEVKKDIKFVRKEFSHFTLIWSPIMEDALNYLGDDGLDKVTWNEKDELDFRRDALHSLAFGFEFMNLMTAWRENLLIAHEAYKLYLETIKYELIDSKKLAAPKQRDAMDKLIVDETFIFQLNTIHTYMLLTAWQSINDAMFEAKMKLDHLMTIEDDQSKNYESKYFANIVVFQEMYEPTISEFEYEKEEVTQKITSAGAVSEDFVDVDLFFDNFREGLAKNEVRDVDWKIPKELSQFMDKMAPQLEANLKVYSRAFLKKLDKAVEEHRKLLRAENRAE